MTTLRNTGALSVAGSATVAVGIVPAAFASAGENGRRAWLDFFAAQIRNRNTRQAYARAAHRLFDWLAEYGIHDVVDIEPVHIAVWLEERMREASRPTVKQELAGVRRLFDWLTVRQVVSSSPAAAVRGPKHTVRRGTTPVLSVAECRRFLRSIPVETIGGLRDRALIATMTYSFRTCFCGTCHEREGRLSSPTAVSGCACLRKAARFWKFPAITTSRHISRTISRPPESTSTVTAPSSARSIVTVRHPGGASPGNAHGKCSGDVPGLQEFRRMSAITRFGRRASRHILKIRRRASRSPSTWPATQTPRRPSSMTGALTASRWMKSRGSGFEETATAMGEQGGRMMWLWVFVQGDS